MNKKIIIILLIISCTILLGTTVYLAVINNNLKTEVNNCQNNGETSSLSDKKTTIKCQKDMGTEFGILARIITYDSEGKIIKDMSGSILSGSKYEDIKPVSTEPSYNSYLYLGNNQMLEYIETEVIGDNWYRPAIIEMKENGYTCEEINLDNIQ